MEIELRSDTLAPKTRSNMGLNVTEVDPTDSRESECEDTVSEAELEEMKSELDEMAQRILHYRATLPDQLKTTFVSILEAQRPVERPVFDPATSSCSKLHDGERENPWEGRVTTDQEDKETVGKIQLLKNKISDNINEMSNVLKRMRDCISTIDNLDSCPRIIHSTFKRKKTS